MYNCRKKCRKRNGILDILNNIKNNAIEHPNRIAIIDQENSLTYEELETKSNHLASYLKQEFGCDNTPIVVFGHKSPFMLICFLACVKSGHSYCPIDISTPKPRVESILHTIENPIVLAVEELECNINDIKVVNRITIEKVIDSKMNEITEECRVAGEDIFYIIFTSGSTGQPKGVQITANCLNHYLEWSIHLGNDYDKKKGKVFLNQAPFSFDLSVMDLYTSFACGGTLWCLNKETQVSYAKLMESLGQSQVSVWVSTPSFADICLTDNKFNQDLMPDLELFLFCGEILTNQTVKRLKERFPKAIIVNTYGPTESTVAVTEVIVTEELNEAESPLPVGRSRTGTWIEIRKPDGTLAQENEKGEIILIGDTVSCGYYRKPDLTEKAFFKCNKNGVEYRGYRTGDKGYLKQGMLYYCGRIDLQIKLHGYRIELEDIEWNMQKLSDISNVVVLPNEKDGKVKSLTAFVSYRKEVDQPFKVSQQIKKQLKEFLPDYMIPKKIIFLDQIPLTNNGKADRKALEGMM
ncbi:D-alanine--poly(phosphoribitol) ligase subunit 1 [Anaerosacchariphilus polymeriproducens]|uniref:D-alanine--poly(Phosphoribitol) ligase subunit 1 n=1 Tax=Anaerosacchariphilus polymeriproducens TaxID=1812858 RepID=A0A371ART0_9FIRM|nr:D-alanine--poly(phosphoribitol) ligase subunit 1 [Anaerosacchariphilus polymeriproducens]